MSEEGPLAEKVDDSDDFNTTIVNLDLGDTGYTAAQNLYWHINTSDEDGKASEDDFVETSGVVALTAGQTSASIEEKVVNDGDQDEKSEDFTIDIGYKIGLPEEAAANNGVGSF